MGQLWRVLIVSCALAFLSEHCTLTWGGRQSKALNHAVILALIAYLSIFAGLRCYYNDTYNYMVGYTQTPVFPDVLTGFSWSLDDNPAFILLNSLMKAAGFRSQTFVLFYSVVFVTSAVCFLKRYSGSFTLSIFLFVCANGYLFSFAAIKQCTSIAIGVLGVPFALKRKWLPFLLLLLLASAFHPYILLFLLIPFLRFRPWSGRTYLLLALTLGAGLLLPQIIGAVIDAAALLGSSYDAEAFIGEGINVFRVLVACVPLILSLVFRRRLDADGISAQECVFLNCSFLYACIMFVGLFGTANYFGRLASYFMLFPAIALPALLKKAPDEYRWLTIAMVVCYLAYFYYENAVNATFSAGFSRITLWEYLRALL